MVEKVCLFMSVLFVNVFSFGMFFVDLFSLDMPCNYVPYPHQRHNVTALAQRYGYDVLVASPLRSDGEVTQQLGGGASHGTVPRPRGRHFFAGLRLTSLGQVSSMGSRCGEW